MIAERRAPVVGRGIPLAGAWARPKTRGQTKIISQGATRVELATAGSAILCSTAELHALAGLCAASARISFYKQNSVLTGVGFEPTPPKRRELESPALDHSAIQPWPRPRRTAGQRPRTHARKGEVVRAVSAKSGNTTQQPDRNKKKRRRTRRPLQPFYNNESENAKAESQAIDATRHL